MICVMEMSDSAAEKRRQRFVQYGFLAVAIGLLMFGLNHRVRQSGDIVPAGSRKTMPNLVLDQLGGGTWKMADHRGQVVVVNYWATWCGPCLEETPGLVKLAQERGAKGLAVVGISMDKGDRKKVKDFVDRFQVPYPVAFPEPMSQLSAGMVGLPTTILVDRSGRVAKTYVGAVRRADFEADVDVLLGER